MKYSRIFAAVISQFWAMQPEKLMAMLEILRFRAGGGMLTASEIEARIGAGQEKQIASQQGDVIVLPLQGVISNRAPMVQDVSTPPGTSAERFTSQFRAAMNDSRIKAIVIDVNSPGGTVGGVDEVATEIFNARGQKPVIAQVNAYAASAAYWIASAAEEMVVTPSGEVGSIGVFALHEDISQFMEMEGIKPTLISAGKYKVEGNPYEPLSADAKAAIQDDVNAYYDMFVRAVARNRNASLKSVREDFGQGRMVRATAAMESGMADRIGTMQETLARFGIDNGTSAPQGQKSGTRKAALLKRELELLEN